MVPMVPKLIWKAFTPALKVFDYSSIPTAQMKTFAMQRQLEAPNSQPEPLDFSLFTFWRTLWFDLPPRVRTLIFSEHLAKLSLIVNVASR